MAFSYELHGKCFERLCVAAQVGFSNGFVGCAPPFALRDCLSFWSHRKIHLLFHIAYTNTHTNTRARLFRCGFDMWVRAKGVFMSETNNFEHFKSKNLSWFDANIVLRAYTERYILHLAQRKWEFQTDNHRKRCSVDRYAQVLSLQSGKKIKQRKNLSTRSTIRLPGTD